MGFWDIMGWLVFGVIAGGVARLLMPGRDPMGCIATMGLGIAGSIVGGGLSLLIFGGGGEHFKPAGFIGAVIGAILLLFLFRKLSVPRREE